MSPYDTPQYAALRDFWDEPDAWSGCQVGLPARAVRVPWSKHWCGYVGIPRSHPYWGLSYSDEVVFIGWEELRVDKLSPIQHFIFANSEAPRDNRLRIDSVINVHGGLTYSADHPPGGLPDGNWWFGFDCAHYDDLSPRDVFNSFSDGIWKLQGEARYKSLKFVQNECFLLAEQLEAIGAANRERAMG